MVVTTSMVPVIEDVNRAGRDTTVNNVIILPNTIFYFLKMLLIMAYYVWMYHFVEYCLSIRRCCIYTLIGFLACSYGFYGLNCTLTCNDKCTGCNNVNGDCNNGCTPGWEGGYCQQRNAYKSHLFGIKEIEITFEK